MEFLLPLPPTKNQLHKIGRNRLYLSKEAKDWQEEAGYLILSQRTGAKIPLRRECYVGISYYIKFDRDIDGGEAILDLLEDMQIIENDNQIIFLVVKKFKDKKNPRVELEITEM